MAKLRKEIADLKSEISDFETYKKNQLTLLEAEKAKFTKLQSELTQLQF